MLLLYQNIFNCQIISRGFLTDTLFCVGLVCRFNCGLYHRFKTVNVDTFGNKFFHKFFGQFHRDFQAVTFNGQIVSGRCGQLKKVINAVFKVSNIFCSISLFHITPFQLEEEPISLSYASTISFVF